MGAYMGKRDLYEDWHYCQPGTEVIRTIRVLPSQRDNHPNKTVSSHKANSDTKKLLDPVG